MKTISQKQEKRRNIIIKTIGQKQIQEELEPDSCWRRSRREGGKLS